MHSERAVLSASAHGSVDLRNIRAANGGGRSQGFLSKILSPKASHRTKKYAKQELAKDALKGHGAFKRFQKCCHCGECAGVTVVHDVASGKNAVKGILLCGSVWLCAVCCTKIALQRAAAVVAAVKEIRAQGGDVLFWTVTTRSHRGQRLKEFFKQFKALLSNALGVRASLKLLDDLDYIGDLKGFEMPVSFVNGFHVHAHILLAFGRKVTEDERRALDAVLSAEWCKQWMKRGLPAPSKEHGSDLRRVKDDEAGAYVVKGNAVGIGYEIASGSITKESSGIPPLDLPVIAADERYSDEIRKRARALFVEYAYATKRKHQMELSKRLAKHLSPELVRRFKKRDEDVAAEETEEPKQIIAGIEKPLYKMLTWSTLISELLDASEKAGSDGIAQLLTHLGIPFAMRSNGRFPIFGAVTVTKPSPKPKP